MECHNKQFMMSVIMLSVVIMSIIMASVIKLNVMAPVKYASGKFKTLFINKKCM
jgi:hypothetical protein